MSYGQVVSQLKKSLGSEIIGYDNLPEHGGCILYMKGPVRRIDITIQALNQGPDNLAQFIREIITNPPDSGSRLSVGVLEGKLAVL